MAVKAVRQEKKQEAIGLGIRLPGCDKRWGENLQGGCLNFCLGQLSKIKGKNGIQ